MIPNAQLTIPFLGTGWSFLDLIVLGTGPVANGMNTSWFAMGVEGPDTNDC